MHLTSTLSLPSPSSAPSITNSQRCAGKWPPCFCWYHGEWRRSGVRAESRSSGLRNANAYRLRLNLRGCGRWQSGSSLLIVCFNQALSQGSGSCRTSGICRLHRDVQWKWEHRPEGGGDECGLTPCAVSNLPALKTTPFTLLCSVHIIVVWILTHGLRFIRTGWKYHNYLSLSVCGRLEKAVNELLNWLWSAGTFSHSL